MLLLVSMQLVLAMPVVCIVLMHPSDSACSTVQPGDESFELYKKERDAVLGSLKRRAKIMVDTLNKLEGISCQPTEGALAC